MHYYFTIVLHTVVAVLVYMQGACSVLVAKVPSKAWNSYDSYDWPINETQLFAEAEAMAARLLPYGYNTLVLDWYWYRDGRGGGLPHNGTPVNYSCQIYFDQYGRMYPDPVRFPSTRTTRSWTPITSRLRSMGLFLGLHLMPGVTTFCDKNHGNCAVPGVSGVRMADIIDYTRKSHGGAICPNCTFYQLNMTKTGSQQWYDAYYAQLAEWGITFVKADFLHPTDPYMDNIKAMATAIKKTGAPIAVSVHGVSTVEQAKVMGPYVNLYRITSDVHDNWGAIKGGFSASAEYAGHKLEGAPGLNGNSWPHHDMLALGKQKPARDAASCPPLGKCPRPNAMSPDEQRVMMTLWAITRSPLIFGGRMSNMSNFTAELLTNKHILSVSENGTDPRLLSPQPSFGYQGIRMKLALCNNSDLFQLWNVSNVRGIKKEPPNLHITYNHTQEVCVRLMVWNQDCNATNNTKMDIYPCDTSHCDHGSNEWVLPHSGEGNITNAWSHHCLTADEKGHISTQPCNLTSKLQKWSIFPSPSVSIRNIGANQCLKYSVPIPVQNHLVWATAMPDGAYVGLFNLEADKEVNMSLRLSDVVSGESCRVLSVWTKDILSVYKGVVNVTVTSHGVQFLWIYCGTSKITESIGSVVK